LTAEPDAALVAVLADAQRLGFLGSRPIDEVIRHAWSFVEAIDGRTGRLIDLGSGGGVPGLVVAHARPDLEVVLIDRRQKRTDVLERAVRRLGLVGRVAVRCADVSTVADASFDIVTARGFGPPATTLRQAARIVRLGGTIVISEPPIGDRWEPRLLDELRVRRTVIGAVARFDGFT
jgi:16S rRNA (guanine527-N7)-methyltransferase